jgi:hypothetical protein
MAGRSRKNDVATARRVMTNPRAGAVLISDDRGRFGTHPHRELSALFDHLLEGEKRPDGTIDYGWLELRFTQLAGMESRELDGLLEGTSEYAQMVEDGVDPHIALDLIVNRELPKTQRPGEVNMQRSRAAQRASTDRKTDPNYLRKMIAELGVLLLAEAQRYEDLTDGPPGHVSESTAAAYVGMGLDPANISVDSREARLARAKEIRRSLRAVQFIGVKLTGDQDD